MIAGTPFAVEVVQRAPVLQGHADDGRPCLLWECPLCGRRKLLVVPPHRLAAGLTAATAGAAGHVLNHVIHDDYPLDPPAGGQ